MQRRKRITRSTPGDGLIARDMNAPIVYSILLAGKDTGRRRAGSIAGSQRDRTGCPVFRDAGDSTILSTEANRPQQRQDRRILMYRNVNEKSAAQGSHIQIRPLCLRNNMWTAMIAGAVDVAVPAHAGPSSLSVSPTQSARNGHGRGIGQTRYRPTDNAASPVTALVLIERCQLFPAVWDRVDFGVSVGANETFGYLASP